MKRSPLIRKAPLKSGRKPLKKTKLRKVGLNRKPWEEQFRERKAADGEWVRSAYSGLLISKSSADPHHPFGKVRERILAYVWIEKFFHEQLHAQNNQSMRMGWLHPQFRGGAHDPDHPRPWTESHERSWPENLKRTR